LVFCCLDNEDGKLRGKRVVEKEETVQKGKRAGKPARPYREWMREFLND